MGEITVHRKLDYGAGIIVYDNKIVKKHILFIKNCYSGSLLHTSIAIVLNRVILRFSLKILQIINVYQKDEKKERKKCCFIIVPFILLIRPIFILLSILL